MVIATFHPSFTIFLTRWMKKKMGNVLRENDLRPLKIHKLNSVYSFNKYLTESKLKKTKWENEREREFIPEVTLVGAAPERAEWERDQHFVKKKYHSGWCCFNWWGKQV